MDELSKRDTAPAASRGCLFCGRHPVRGWYMLRHDRLGRDDPPLVARLCWLHYGVLKAAGPEGRVYQPTGVRWGLVAEYLPLGDPGAP